MAPTARHRANPSPRLWAVRGLAAATTVPVGALAGCVVAAVAATAAHPALGVAGLAVAGVPLTLSGVRARRRAARKGGAVTGGARTRGRHAAGVPLRLDPAVDPAAPSPAAALALSLPAPVLPAPRAALEDRQEVVVRVGAEPGDVTVLLGRRDVTGVTGVTDAAEVTTVAPEQRAAEIAQLNRLWASGTGPDTGSLRVAATA